MGTWAKVLMIALLPILAGMILILFAQPALCTVDQVSATALNFALATATPAPLIDAPKYAPQCTVADAVEGDVLVRSYPGEEFAELGMLSEPLTVLGMTDDGWVTVSYHERRGWLRAENLRFTGTCGSLPFVRNPMIPNAPIDSEVFAVQVDRDGEGDFRNAISTPDGDSIDVLWIVVINLYTEPPNNMREFTLTLECDGANPDALRWGWSYHAPNLMCGDAVTIPFMVTNAQQPFTITFAPDSPQSYINYRLKVTGGAAG